MKQIGDHFTIKQKKMIKNLEFDFQVDKEKNTITVKREFDAGLPIVWDAYTRSEILDQWWAPKPWKTKTKSMDFRDGGKWNYAMVGPEGEEHWCIAEYSAIQKQKKFSVMDAFTDKDGNINTSMPRARWVISFSEKGDRTLVNIHIAYNTLEDLEAIIKMGFKEGLAMAMDNLDELLPELKK